jgi:hypothetical protein
VQPNGHAALDATANAITAEVFGELARMQTADGSPFPMPYRDRIRAAVERGLLASSPRGSRITHAVQSHLGREER